jgi:peptide maturation system protein (TIGR04066 family)
LARAVIRDCKILALEEATANIFDVNTNAIIKTNKAVYEFLQAGQKSCDDDDSISSVEKLKAKGFLSSKRVKEIIHPPEIREAAQRIFGEDDLTLDIDTPVIFVLGTGERTNKFEIQLALRENMMKMGYKASQVGTREYCELLGFHSFPRFMFGNGISEISKIASFNRFIKSLERDECPDVIIIGVPRGIMPFNNRLPNGYGILAYEVSQAVTPDSTVYSDTGSNAETGLIDFIASLGEPDKNLIYLDDDDDAWRPKNDRLFRGRKNKLFHPSVYSKITGDEALIIDVPVIVVYDFSGKEYLHVLAKLKDIF